MKVIFIFCEGVHDIAFLNTVLGLNDKDFKLFDKKISQYPTPLGDYYGKKFEEYKNLDLRFDKPVYPLIPSLTYTDKKEETMLVFYNSGGMTKYKEVNNEVDTIKKRLPLMIKFNETQKDTTKKIESFGFLFIYDADTDGIAKRFEEFIINYSKVLDITKKEKEYEVNPNEWHSGKQVGCYIFTEKASDKGSLENIVIPLIKDQSRYLQAREYIEKNKVQSDKVSKNENKVNKASITTVGQFHEPGYAMSVVLQNDSFLDLDKLKADQQCNEIVEFFKKVIA